jgi:hypothetical protein
LDQYDRGIRVAEQELDGLASRGTYRQIADEVRQLITSGRLRPGALVPSELALAQQRTSKATRAWAMTRRSGMRTGPDGSGRSSFLQ